MRLRALHLLAFGPFTRRTLDFGVTGTGVHLITGANEAGKSSALRAIGDLRFGIHPQSRDDFVHDYKSMRIAGCFDGPAGTPVTLLRRKGNKATLQSADAQSLEALADPGVPPEVARALTGGLTRAEFELLFGIDHARLRAGGRQLLSGEAEVGAALFDASAGSIGGIRKLLDTIEVDAKRYFNPHGRTEAATLNNAVKAWDAARRSLKEVTVKPADWARLDAAAREAEAGRLAVADRLRSLLREQADGRELKVLIPQLAEFDACGRALAALADAPQLAPDAAERRRVAETEVAAAETAARRAARELAEAEAAHATLGPDPVALAHAEAIERLATEAARAGAYRIDLRRFANNAEDAAARLTAAAARIAPGLSAEAVVAALPSDAETRDLRERAAEAERIAVRRKDALDRAAALREQLGADGPPAPPDDAALDALRDALDQLLDHQQSAGRALPRRDELARGRAELAALVAALADQAETPRHAVDDAIAWLAGIRPLARTMLNNLRDDFAARQAQRAALAAEVARLDADLGVLRIEETDLLATGQPVTEASRNATRTARDQAWLDLRERSFAGAAGSLSDTLARADRYFLLVIEADRQADALHADATRATRLATCQLRIEQVRAARADRATELAALDHLIVTANTDWQTRRRDAGLPDLGFDALADWQARRDQALALHATVTREAESLAALDGATDTARAHLAALLGKPAHADPTRLVAEARQRLQAAAELALAHERHQAEIASLRRQLEQTDGLAASQAARLDELHTGLAGWHARLLLPAEARPADIPARLDELTRLVALDQARRDAVLTLAQRQVELDQLAQDTARLARQLDVAAEGDPVDLAASFAARLAAARETARRAAALDDQMRVARAARDLALADAERARATLADLCAAAGCTSPADLPALELRAAERRDAAAALARARAELDRTAPGSTPDALRERIAGLDLPALDLRLTELDAAVARANDDNTRAIRDAADAATALAAIDASDRAAREREAMENEAARVRGAIRPWLRLRLAHALLGRAMDSFRERAQAPMVAAASGYFATMTGGRHVRLVADEIDDRPVLVAETADGARIAPEAMSEGTADQLYLALRLAALDLRADQDMPLVLDDVLMTSDDDRAARILAALAGFARRRQVLVFTHHDHLAPIARGIALPEGAAPVSVLRLD